MPPIVAEKGKKMNNISKDYIRDYIRATINPSEGVAADMERYAAIENIPIIQPEVAQLLRVLIMGLKRQRILEVGTAIGYSALVMAQAADRSARVVSLEINPAMANKAEEFFEKAGLD